MRGSAGYGGTLRVLVILAALPGCSPLDCTTEARAALSVTIRDATTLETVRGDLRVIASDGVLADTFETRLVEFPETVDRDTVDFGPIPLAWERAGTYRVEVDAPAYHPWTEEGIRVGRDACHVRTEEVVAQLQPQDP